MSTLIIAEAGVNHNGDIGLAKLMVAEAAKAGADVVKFQAFVAEKNTSQHAPKAEYQKASTDPNESQYEMLRKLELSREDHQVLIEECANHGITYLSTAFDTDSFDMLTGLGISVVKIPSGELTNLPFLRHACRLRLPVLLSTGMASLGDIEAAIEVIEAVGTPRSLITVMHCTTEYPVPMEDVNLHAMVSIRTAFGVEVGYSDHTRGIEVANAAVALGAKVIEKHFTMDRSLPGPDHLASLEPSELAAMVTSIRNIERALGDGIKRPAPSERKNIGIARKSLVASRLIAAGERFDARNMTTKRPGTGISPMRWDEVCGMVAKRQFEPDELIEL